MPSPDEIDEIISKFVKARSITLKALAKEFVNAQDVISQSLAFRKIWIFHDDKPQKESTEFFEYIQTLSLGTIKTILLGLAYQLGLRVEKHLVIARSFYQAAIRTDNLVPPVAISSFAYMLQHEKGEDKDLVGAKKLYQQAAELGDPVAMSNLAYMLQHGEGGNKDTEAARYFLQQAAKFGNPEAINDLAIILTSNKDLIDVRNLFQQAVELGYPVAMANLAYMLQHGKGGDKDLVGAKKLYQQVAELGIPEAMNNLAIMFEHGVGGAQDLPRAKMFKTLYDTFKNDSTLNYPEDKAAIAYIVQQLLQGKGAFVKPATVKENKEAITSFLLAIINQEKNHIEQQSKFFIAKVYVAAQMAYKMHKTKQQLKNILVFLPVQEVNKYEVALLARVFATKTGSSKEIPTTVTEILAAVEKNFHTRSSSAAARKNVGLFTSQTTTTTDEPDTTRPPVLLSNGL